jgi:Ulp1 family protease
VDRLQTNGYDCGVWVLASVAAVLRGFDVTGFSEPDIPWFRQFIMYHILSLPVTP